MSTRKFLLPLAWGGATLAFLVAPAAGVLDANWVRQLTLVALMCLIVSGLNLSYGYAGQLSFASSAMYAAGAYLTGYLALEYTNNLIVALALSALIGLGIGLLTGIPGLRLGGWMLAVTSIFLVMIVPDIVQIFAGTLGGHVGLHGIPRAELFGAEVDEVLLFQAAVVVTSLWVLLFRNLVTSRYAGAFTVLRESPVLASSMGVSVFRLKLQAYALSGVPAAMAGTLFAYLDGFIAPTFFGVSMTIGILAASILGGSRSVYGVFFGATIMQLGPMRTTAFGDYAMIAYGVLLILGGVLLSGGMAGLVRSIARRLHSTDSKRPSDLAAAVVMREPLPALPGQTLDLTAITKKFGGVKALNGVSLRATPGSVVALIGPNGSGKTTLLNVISGLLKPDTGTVLLGQESITGRPARSVARKGVRRTFQTPIVPSMSVAEVVSSARFSEDRAGIIESMLRLPRHHRAVGRDRAATRAALAATGLSDLADQPADSLPLGTRRMVELARVLASRPGVILLDEVASGLDEDEVEAMAAVVGSLRDAGATVILVEHNFALVQSLADRVVVLSQGEVVTDGTPAEIAVHPEVLRHYLGEPVSTASIGATDDQLA